MQKIYKVELSHLRLCLEGKVPDNNEPVPVGLAELFEVLDVQIINEIDSSNKLIQIGDQTMLVNYQILKPAYKEAKHEACISMFGFDLDSCQIMPSDFIIISTKVNNAPALKKSSFSDSNNSSSFGANSRHGAMSSREDIKK